MASALLLKRVIKLNPYQVQLLLNLQMLSWFIKTVRLYDCRNEHNHGHYAPSLAKFRAKICLRHRYIYRIILIFVYTYNIYVVYTYHKYNLSPGTLLPYDKNTYPCSWEIYSHITYTSSLNYISKSLWSLNDIYYQ